MSRISPLLPPRHVCLFLLGACLLATCAPARLRVPSAPNIVVVLVDTLRADRLGIYGNRRGLTPFLDSLAERAVVFHQAYAQAPWTNPSVASLFTSRFQSQHGIVNFAASLDSSEILLAEVLRDQGYETGGFLANGLVGRHRGFAQGFDDYVALWGKMGDRKHPTPEKPRTGTINALAETWLEDVPLHTPFFLYVHYIEPHGPYMPPARFLDRVTGGQEQPSPETVRERIAEQIRSGALTPDAETRGYVQNFYDGEVAAVDAGVKDLWTALERRGALDDTIFVFTADHGEGFAEHGFMGHGAMLYNEVIHVPLLMVLPGEPERVDVEEPVGLVDVAPTLVELSGGVSPHSFEGHSLQPVVLRARHPWLTAVRELWRRDPEPPVFSERIAPGERTDDDRVHHERAVMMDGRKLIVGMNGEHETYDLARDPGEQVPLTGHHDEALAVTVGAFQAHFAVNTIEAPPIDPELRARMRALGYVD